jgi:hypothetical protein
MVFFSSPLWGINWAYKNYNMPPIAPFRWLGKISSITPFVGIGHLILSCRCVINFAQFKFYLYGIPSCWLKRSSALRLVREFTHVAKTLAPFAPVLASLETINALLTLHSLDIDSLHSNSLLNFQPNSNLEFSMEFFRSTFLHMYHLWLVVLLAWYLSIFEIILTLKI